MEAMDKLRTCKSLFEPLCGRKMRLGDAFSTLYGLEKAVYARPFLSSTAHGYKKTW